jgi:hypothetical protein
MLAVARLSVAPSQQRQRCNGVVGVPPLAVPADVEDSRGEAPSQGRQNTEGCAAQSGQSLSDQCLEDIRLGVPWMYSQSLGFVAPVLLLSGEADFDPKPLPTMNHLMLLL